MHPPYSGTALGPGNKHGPPDRRPGRSEKEINMALILWILAVILVVSGIVSLFRGQMLWGIVLIIVGLLVGPGGVSIFT